MKLFFLLGFLLLSSCSVEKSQNSSGLIEPMTEFDSQFLTLSSDKAEGTGRFIAQSRFASTRTNAHVILGGQFFKEESFIILHLFFDDFLQDTGIQLRLSPSAQPNAIDIQYAEPTFPLRPLTTISQALAEDKSFRIRIETQNTLNSSPRILIWNDNVFYNESVRVRKDSLFAGNAEYDSARNRQVFFVWGSGLNWGLTINQSRMTEIRRDAFYVTP